MASIREGLLIICKAFRLSCENFQRLEKLYHVRDIWQLLKIVHKLYQFRNVIIESYQFSGCLSSLPLDHGTDISGQTETL